MAQVVLGTAESGKPTQARLRDKHGRTHYVMVEPDQEGETFQAGEDLLLVRRAGSVFYAIRAPGGALLEDTE